MLYSKKERELENELLELKFKVSSLERKIESQRMSFLSKMMRIQSGEKLSFDYLLSHVNYKDLSPEEAYEVYLQNDRNFVLLNVGNIDKSSFQEIKGVVNNSYEELLAKDLKVKNKLTPLLVISENGVSSILACNLLHKLGFLNISNVSGGYKFWKGLRQSSNFQALA